MDENPIVSLSDSLYVLNINNWEWTIPKVSGNPPPVVPFSHQANVIGNYMVITFGKSYNYLLFYL
jgi:hypothetical protein